MKPKRVRYQLFLPEDLSHRLEGLAADPGVTKSAILAQALTAFLDRKALGTLENRFGRRLERMSMALGRIERDGHILLESLALFIRYELMVQAPLAESDEAGRAIGRDRFNAFVARVGEALASGQRTLGGAESKPRSRRS